MKESKACFVGQRRRKKESKACFVGAFREEGAEGAEALADLLTQFSEYDHEYRLLHEFLTTNTDKDTNF